MSEFAPNLRFREARERLGLSPPEVAALSGVVDADVWEIEGLENDLTLCYSPNQIRQFCRVLGIRPIELFGEEITEPALSGDGLVRLIHQECHSRGITLGQFEDIVGWRLSSSMEPTEKLFEDMTVDGLQWLCRELRIDWRRVL